MTDIEKPAHRDLPAIMVGLVILSFAAVSFAIAMFGVWHR